MLVLEGHRASVLSVAYAPDSRTLASGGVDQTVRLWDLATGQGRVVLSGLDAGGPVLSLAFSGDGNTLAVGTYSCVTFWDLSTGEPLGTYRGERPGTYIVAFTPDSRMAVAAGYLDPHLTVCDTATGQSRGILRGHRSGVLAVAHAPRQSLLVSGGGTPNSDELRVWDTQYHTPLAVLEEPLRVAVQFYFTAPPAANRFRDVLAAHTQAVYSVAVSPDARLVASGGKDRVTKLWDWEAGRVRFTLGGHTDTVVAVSFTPDGWTLLTADEAGTVRLWDVETGRLRSSWDWKIGRLRSVVFAPDGMTAAAGGDNSVLVWDVD
jgi:WD40 repeat protein